MGHVIGIVDKLTTSAENLAGGSFSAKTRDRHLRSPSNVIRQIHSGKMWILESQSDVLKGNKSSAFKKTLNCREQVLASTGTRIHAWERSSFLSPVCFSLTVRVAHRVICIQNSQQNTRHNQSRSRR